MSIRSEETILLPPASIQTIRNAVECAGYRGVGVGVVVV